MCDSLLKEGKLILADFSRFKVIKLLCSAGSPSSGQPCWIVEVREIFARSGLGLLANSAGSEQTAPSGPKVIKLFHAQLSFSCW